MENKRLSFGYEDTDRSIEIELYGLVFEIRNIDNVEKIRNINTNNKEEIENRLEKILGVGSIDKINKKRKEDGYKELDLDIELNIFGCIMEVYSKNMLENTIGRTSKVIDELNKDMDSKISNFNREQRRNYNRYGNKRNYRRY